MKKLITVCATCQKVKISEEIWSHKRLTRKEQGSASHGYCPYCFDKVISQIEDSQELERQPCAVE